MKLSDWGLPTDCLLAFLTWLIDCWSNYSFIHALMITHSWSFIPSFVDSLLACLLSWLNGLIDRLIYSFTRDHSHIIISLIHSFIQFFNWKNWIDEGLILWFRWTLVPNAPLGVQVYSIRPTVAKVLWEPIKPNPRHGSLLGYKVYYRTADSKKWNTVSCNCTNVSVKNLKPGGKYRIRVFAFTTHGNGIPSPALEVTTGQGEHLVLTMFNIYL